MSNYPQNQKFDKLFLKKVIKESNYGSGLVPHRAWLWCEAQKIAGWFLGLIFPKACLGCGEFTHSTSSGQASKTDFDYVCGKCFREIELKNTFECIDCKRQTLFGLTCAFCAKDNPVAQLIIAAELSDKLVDKMLKTYKYEFVYSMAAPLSIIAKKCIKKLLLKGFNLFEDDPLLVPVPLHRRRFNWRGFNQAELLVKNIADTYHMSCSGDILVRVADSKHQAEIKSREERLNNVRNNFAVTGAGAVKGRPRSRNSDSSKAAQDNISEFSLRGRTIILVDDICTTGATLNECAKVLKESGARKVIGFVIARG